MECRETAEAMATAASRLLGALTGAQREKICFDFADEAQRRDWSFLPVPERLGLQLGELDDGQRKLAHELIAAGTSMPGYAKVVSVIAMEHVLRALTMATQPDVARRLFDPGRYSLKMFGTPGDAGAWGWQIAGHHVSLNYTVAGGRYVSPTPMLLGSQPSSFGTLAPLSDDEELGYRFVSSLDDAQRKAAVIHHRPPPDLATRIVPRIGDVERPDPVFAPEPGYVIDDAERDILSYVRHGPKGVPGHALNAGQLGELEALVAAFTGRMPDDVAAAQLRLIGEAGLENLWFAWAGDTAPGGRHYFRVQGPVLLIEHDNTQDNGRHIHSAWRNPVDDFGDDLLGAHLLREHGLPS
ncbi:MAG TPA: DUF3500 domain-containing protein [Streptosporangiaceae bacterium]|nr:DUF3500 domain-containing protein [Streptosporangiaceae bacterium]